MSYEGQIHQICVNGHFLAENNSGYVGRTTVCPACNCAFKWFATLDCTNGYEQEGDSESFDPPKKHSHFEDVPMLDHRGNHYVEKRWCWIPLKDKNYEKAYQIARWRTWEDD